MYIQFQIHTKPDYEKNLKEFAEDLIDRIIDETFPGMNIDTYEFINKPMEKDPRYNYIKFVFKPHTIQENKCEKIIKFSTANELMLGLVDIFGFEAVSEQIITNIEVLSINAREYATKAELEKDQKTTNFWA